MQVRTRNLDQKKDKIKNWKLRYWLIFLFYIEVAVWSVAWVNYWIIGIIIVVITSLPIFTFFVHNFKVPLYHFKHTWIKNGTIPENFFHHQKYYHNPELIEHVQKSIWKEYYQLPFLYKAYGILGWSTLLLIYIAWIMDGISKNISVFTNIIVMLATFWQLFLAFILIFFLRRKYTDKLKNPWNRYLLGSIDTKRYSISRKVNKQWLNDYILEKI